MNSFIRMAGLPALALMLASSNVLAQQQDTRTQPLEQVTEQSAAERIQRLQEWLDMGEQFQECRIIVLLAQVACFVVVIKQAIMLRAVFPWLQRAIYFRQAHAIRIGHTLGRGMLTHEIFQP